MFSSNLSTPFCPPAPKLKRKAFLFSLGAGGQKGVERLLENMQKEIRRNMILMGCKSVKDLDASKIIYRN